MSEKNNNTKSPYDLETGTIRGGFKPPFHVIGPTDNFGSPWLVDTNGKELVSSYYILLDTFTTILNEYCEMQESLARLERKCDEACKKLDENNNL